MDWKRVENYWLGYSLPTKQFSFYYKLVGESSVLQIFPTPQEFLALADMFRNEGPINFNTEGKYFISAAEDIGEQEAHPQVVGNTEFVNLAEYVTYGLGVSAEVRRANRKGYQTAYDLAHKLSATLCQKAGDLEIEIDETGDSVWEGEHLYWIGVRLHGNVNIVGAGIDRTRIKFFPDTVTFSACAFYQDSGRHNSISDCTITGPANGSDEPAPLFYGIKHLGVPDADVITDETLTLRNVKIDGEFFAAVTSNEGDLICTLDGCDLSAYLQAVGYFVNFDTHKQLIVKNNCHFHDSGLHTQRAALIYVSPGIAIDISSSRFSASQRFGIYINGTKDGKPLYSRITNNVFEETLAQAIQVAKNNRPLIQGNLIKTYLGGIAFFGSYLGAEVLDNVVIQPEEPAPGWYFIGGAGWASGAHVKVHSNTVDTSSSEAEGLSSVISMTGDGVVWDVEGNLIMLNRPNLAGIAVEKGSNVLAFVSNNRFTGRGDVNHGCMGFHGGTIFAKGNIVETASGYAFSFVEDTLVNAYLDDNDVAASVVPLYISLASESDGKIRGSGNNFPYDFAWVNWMKDFKYQMITPKTGVCPTVVPSEADTKLPMSYNIVHISGDVPINNFYYGNANVTKLFCGEIRVIFDDEGATTTGEGNIKPQTTDKRVVGKVYSFVLDSRTGWWYE